MRAPLGRLRRRSEFIRVAKAGRKWATPGVVVQAAMRGFGTGDADAPRYGLTASKKVGNAVARNRARRRLRAAAAAVFPACAQPGRDYVLIARRSTLTRRFDDLRHDLEAALDRVDSGFESAGRRAGRGKAAMDAGKTGR